MSNPLPPTWNNRRPFMKRFCSASMLPPGQSGTLVYLDCRARPFAASGWTAWARCGRMTAFFAMRRKTLADFLRQVGATPE